MANLYGNNQLAVTTKKRFVHNSNKREKMSMNNTEMKCVNLCGEHYKAQLRDIKELE